MEPFLADLINNNKVPKIIRYIIVSIICIFLIIIGIGTALNSTMFLGKIFGVFFTIMCLSAYIYLINKIRKK